MDLGGWNSDFDPSFLSCWDEGNETNSNKNGSDNSKDNKQEGGGGVGRNNNRFNRSSPRDDPSLWGDGSLNQWSQLSNLEYEATASEKSCSKTASSGGDEAEQVSNDGSSSQGQQGQVAAVPQQHLTTNAPPGGSVQRIPTTRGPPSISTTASGAPSSVGAAQVSAATSVASVPQVATTTAQHQTGNNNNPPSGSGLHPVAIQSTATCPPHQYPVQSQPQQQQQVPAALPQQQPRQNAMPPYNLYGGLAGGLDTTMASLAASLQGHAAAGGSHTNMAQHLSNLAANFVLAGGAAAAQQQQQQGNTSNMVAAAAPPVAAVQGVHGQNATPHHHHIPLQQQQHQGVSTATNTASSQPPPPQHAAAVNTVPVVANSSVGSSTTKHHTSRSRKSNRSRSKAKSSTQQQGSTNGTVPPFYLFDAPIELRSNFVQNQRRLGIPVEEDCNSYHYGQTVKGFHPQNLLDAKHPHSRTGTTTTASGSSGASSGGASGAGPPPAPVQLVDARHGNSRQQMAGRVKNEREQKRAQKITELIEQLRINMETGGWKVEMRSKFHTLSTCAEYVKHMIKSLKEKEEKTKQLKEELEVKQQKIAEDKSAQESRSDPESVTSSLTSSTGGSNSHSKVEKDSSRKRKAADGDESTTSTSHGGNKKHCDSNSRNVSSYGTCEDSSGDDRRSGSGSGSGRSRGPFNDVSDITDSNRGSSSNYSGSGGSDDGPTVTRDAAEDEQNSAGSISSDAAVRSERSSHVMHGTRQHHTHKDVVFTDKKPPEKRKADEINSMNSSFELDYEEVFYKSNIPQIIAATSGKVVAWNEVFRKATGLRKSEMDRMTIFSLVQPDKLANFFQIVAAALKPEEEQASSATDTSTDDSGAQRESDIDSSTTKEEEKPEAKVIKKEDPVREESQTSSLTDDDKNSDTPVVTRTQDFSTITLPCIDFPGMKKLRESSEKNGDPKPLYVTVTLMDDEDPNKRCFHCVFTNCKGTDGALGLITPELLEALFTIPAESPKKSKSHRHHHHHKSKRPRSQEPCREEERLDGDKIDKIIPIPTKNANSAAAEEKRHSSQAVDLSSVVQRDDMDTRDASKAIKNEDPSPSKEAN